MGLVSTYYPKIRVLREKSERSQEYIANKINISFSAYVRYERGEREVPFPVINKLAKYYGVTNDYFTIGAQKLK